MTGRVHILQCLPRRRSAPLHGGQVCGVITEAPHLVIAGNGRPKVSKDFFYIIGQIFVRKVCLPQFCNDSWGYCAWDQNWKSAEEIAAIKKKLNGMGINYLLNVGPDGLGRIPGASQDILRAVAKTL